MIKEKELKILITRRNISYYKNLNYDIIEIDKSILVKIEDINKNSHTKITAICDICGEETNLMLYKYYINKNRCNYYGCKKCSRIKFKKTCFDKYGFDNPLKVDEIKKRVINTNIEKYGVKTTLQSEKCNPLFFSSVSNKETNIYNYIKEKYKGKIIRSDKSVLNGKELDIYLPDLKLAIEFDGLYWHNEINKNDRNYHLKKTEECNKKGIELIHIFEDEYIYKYNIVKSILLNKLNLIENKIFARKTKLKEINTEDAKNFLGNNHIQGYTSSSVKLGLYYDNELVSVMLFSRKTSGGRISFDGYELSRFANKINTNIIGAASKLLKYFEKTYKPKEIRSYSDRRLFNGEIYNILGFKKTHINPSSYWYVINDERKHKSLFTKQKLEKQGYDIQNKTEHEIMLERKIYRIYDCGTVSYTKMFDNQ
jgi:hypothetical protein